MARVMDAPIPGMAAAGAMRAKPATTGGEVESITIRRAGENGFIVEKTFAGGAPGGQPEQVASIDDAMGVVITSFEGAGAAEASPEMPGPDEMGGPEAESGIPGGPPPERPGVKYEEAGPVPPPQDEQF